MGSVQSEKYCLKWNDFEENIGTAFREMRNDNDLYDVTVVGGEGGSSFKIQAHKVTQYLINHPFVDTSVVKNVSRTRLSYLPAVRSLEVSSEKILIRIHFFI